MSLYLQLMAMEFLVLTKEYDLVQKCRKWEFFEELKKLPYLPKCVHSKILNIELLLLRIENLSLDSLTSFTFKSKMEIPMRQPRTHWNEYFEDLIWNHLGFYQQIVEVGARDAWRFNFELMIPPQPWVLGHYRVPKKKDEEDEISSFCLFKILQCKRWCHKAKKRWCFTFT